MPRMAGNAESEMLFARISLLSVVSFNHGDREKE